MTTIERGVEPPRATGRLRAFIEADRVQNFLVAVIVVNAIVLGLETSEPVMAAAGSFLKALDRIALTIFVVELAIKIVVYRAGFFRNPWNVFDFAVVAIALVPAGQGLSVLRALRVLRAFRLLTILPRMRTVVQGLLAALPAMGSVIAIMALIFYVFAVMATKLFGGAFDPWFGTVGRSLFSLFQVMTLESWSMGLVRPVMEVFPYAWVFFVSFILITTFAVLNLFIAIIVNSMHNATQAETAGGEDEIAHLTEEVRRLGDEIRAMRGAGGQDAR